MAPVPTSPIGMEWTHPTPNRWGAVCVQEQHGSELQQCFYRAANQKPVKKQGEKQRLTGWWFQPTHLNDMLVKLGSSSHNFRGEH